MAEGKTLLTSTNEITLGAINVIIILRGKNGTFLFNLFKQSSNVMHYFFTYSG